MFINRRLFSKQVALVISLSAIRMLSLPQHLRKKMQTALILIFICGYSLIALEHKVRINKAAIALVTGVLCWVIYIVSSTDTAHVNEELMHHLGDISSVLLFLLGAMAIVELIDAHDGFDLITTRINSTNKVKLLWILCFITFFLSAVLDNLTTTIVIVSLLRKLIRFQPERFFYTGMVVIAANAGGAWSPIGDVTTTMLWIGGQITSFNIMSNLLLPSLACIIVPLIYMTFRLKGNVERPVSAPDRSTGALSRLQKNTVFVSAILVLIMVPVFKTLTHLPPYMGMLIGLGVLWIITEVIHGDKDEVDKHAFSVAQALRKIDTPSILFFFGILVSIAALEATGVLFRLASWMTDTLSNDNLIVLSLGIVSAVIDNVPLVAGVQGMYPLTVYPTDHNFWHFLAYCTGTGGSFLIIGSAAGVAAMGMENISFGWYLRKMSALALLGYLSGALVYILQRGLFN
jgi:Na+/H+ antiporter NhaD/arsenite permease-like protein